MSPRTQTNSSRRARISGNAENLGGILAALLGGRPDLDGAKSIAQGKDAVFAKIDEIAKEHELPERYAEDLKHQVEDAEDVELLELRDGTLAISGKMRSNGHSDLDGFDIGSLLNAARFSDRHGGRRMTDELHGIFGDLGSRVRADRGKPEPMKDFLGSAVDALMPKQEKMSRPMALDFSLAAMIAAAELARYPRNTGNHARKLAAAFAKLVGDSEVKDPVKFKNLGTYLEVYGVSLKNLAERARQFEKEPQVNEAEALGRELSHIGVVMTCVARDAAEKADAAQKALLNI